MSFLRIFPRLSDFLSCITKRVNQCLSLPFVHAGIDESFIVLERVVHDKD